MVEIAHSDLKWVGIYDFGSRVKWPLGPRGLMYGHTNNFSKPRQVYKSIDFIHEFETLFCTISYVKEKMDVCSCVIVIDQNIMYVFASKHTHVVYLHSILNNINVFDQPIDFFIKYIILLVFIMEICIP